MVGAGLKPDYIAVFKYKLVAIHEKITELYNAIEDDSVDKDLKKEIIPLLKKMRFKKINFDAN